MTTTLASTGRPVTAKTVHPDNVYLARKRLERYDAATDSYTPWANTNVTVSFTLDERGEQPITGMADIPLAPVAIVPGTYATEIPTATMNLLLPYVGQTVYEVTRAGATLTDARVATPLVVRVPRYAQ